MNIFDACSFGLHSKTMKKRIEAFDALMQLSPAELNKLWRISRQIVPLHGGELDVFSRVEVLSGPLNLDRAIVTVITEGFEQFLSVLLDSLARVGNTVPVVVFAVNDVYYKVRDWPGVVAVRCVSRETPDVNVKGVIYSCTRWVKAKYILALESDILALASLDPLWTLIEHTRLETIAGCRPQCFPHELNTLQWVYNQERAKEVEIPWMNGEKFLFNGGVVMGDFAAWQAIEHNIRDLGAWANVFIEGSMEATYRDEMVFNWAANHVRNKVELAPGWNTSFYSLDRDMWVETRHENGKRAYYCNDEPARLLHFMGRSRYGPDSLLDQFVRELQEDHAPSPTPNIVRHCRRCHFISANPNDFLIGMDALFPNAPRRLDEAAISGAPISSLCWRCGQERRPAPMPRSIYTPIYECVDCGHKRGQCSCWVPGSHSQTPKANGLYEALCVNCDLTRQGMNVAQRQEILKELFFELEASKK